MPMILTFAAMSAEAAAAAAAASAAMTAAAPVAAATTAAATLPAAATALAPELTAAAIPGLQGGITGALSGTGAGGIAPAAGIGQAAPAAQVMSPEIALNQSQAAVQAANNPVMDPNATFAANQSSAQGINTAMGPPSPGAYGTPGNSANVNEGLLKGVDYAEIPGVDVAHAGSQTGNAFKNGIDAALKFTKDYPLATSLVSMGAQQLLTPKYKNEKKQYKGYTGNFQASEPTTDTYTPVYKPTAYAVGGPVEQMSAQNAIGTNQMYPQSQLQSPMYSNPMVQRPQANNIVSSGIDAGVDPYTGEARFAAGGDVDADVKRARENRRLMGIRNEQEQAEQMETAKSYNAKGMTAGKGYSRTQQTYSPFTAATKEYAALAKKYGIPVAPMAKTSVDVSGDTEDVNFAGGGIAHGLGGYSDGGRLLKGPGDGVSDSIPAVIGNKQPARLADGEFVIPARIVSELGNGSTEAGARQLYAMMERIQKGRKKSIGKNKVAVNSKANKHLPK